MVRTDRLGIPLVSALPQPVFPLFHITKSCIAGTFVVALLTPCGVLRINAVPVRVGIVLRRKIVAQDRFGQIPERNAEKNVDKKTSHCGRLCFGGVLQ